MWSEEKEWGLNFDVRILFVGVNRKMEHIFAEPKYIQFDALFSN